MSYPALEDHQKLIVGWMLDKHCRNLTLRPTQQRSKSYIFTNIPLSLADPGGHRWCAPPTGSNSFVFAYVFTKKCLRRKLAPPQWLGTPPQREILDLPLIMHIIHNNIDIVRKITCHLRNYSQDFAITLKIKVITFTIPLSYLSGDAWILCIYYAIMQLIFCGFGKF